MSGTHWQNSSRRLGAGEQWVEDFDGGQFAQQLEQLGLPATSAKDTVTHMSKQMLSCILRLYRSALDVGSEWQPALSNVVSPGLVLWGLKDEGCPATFADQLGHDTKARRILKLETGHWFPLQGPEEVAKALKDHWAV